jgi:DNA-binding MarR family transcriptional regulator
MTRNDERACNVTDLRSVFDDLVRFETRLWNALDERLQAECGVTLANLNVMLVIEATPMCRVFDIARALEITVGGTSQAVDRLAKAGWCARSSHPTDRRSSLVELTAEGAVVLRTAAPFFDDELDRLLRAPLNGSALERLADSLHVLRQSASAPVPATATGTTAPEE